MIFGLSNLVTPAVAEAAESSQATARAVGLRYGLIGSVVLIPYLAVLLLMPRTVLAAVYGSASPYVGQAAPLRWFVVTYVFVYTLQTAQAILNGLGRSRDVSIISFTGLVLQDRDCPAAGDQGRAAGILCGAVCRPAGTLHGGVPFLNHATARPGLVSSRSHNAP